MQKTAQERGILNKVREKANLGGAVLERINPEFRDLMERLRTADEAAREEAADLKQLISTSKSFLKRRDYLSVATQLSYFHEHLQKIAQLLYGFKSSVNLKHYKFLLDQFDSEHKERLFNYSPEENLKFSKVIENSLIKNADLAGWFEDLSRDNMSEKSRAMKEFEKRFLVGELKQLKEQTINFQDRSEKFLLFTLSIFRKLASALATRKVDDYMRISTEYLNKFTIYHKSFLDYYKNNITPLKEHYQKIEEEKYNKEKQRMQDVAAKEIAEREDKFSRIPKSPLHNQFINEEPSITNTQPLPSPKSQQEVLNKLDEQHTSGDNTMITPPMPLVKKLNPDDVNTKVEKSSHQDFITVITKFAEENKPEELLGEILAYSEYLEEENSEDSLKLLAIAEGLSEDLKENLKKMSPFELGKFNGEEDLKNQGFGSDVVSGIRALLPEHQIPENKDSWMEYLYGYAEGCKMPLKHFKHEEHRVLGHFGEELEKQAGIFDVFKKNRAQPQNTPEVNKPDPLA